MKISVIRFPKCASSFFARNIRYYPGVSAYTETEAYGSTPPGRVVWSVAIFRDFCLGESVGPKKLSVIEGRPAPPTWGSWLGCHPDSPIFNLPNPDPKSLLTFAGIPENVDALINPGEGRVLLDTEGNFLLPPRRPPSSSDDWLHLSCIRHPVHRFFSALYYSRPTYYLRNHDEDGRASSLHALEPEEQIKKILKNPELLAGGIYELSMSSPGNYTTNFEVLKSLDLIIIQEEMAKGLSDLKDKSGIVLENCRADTSNSNIIYQNFFNYCPRDERKKLTKKYWEPVLELYKDDMEVYEYFLQRYL